MSRRGLSRGLDDVALANPEIGRLVQPPDVIGSDPLNNVCLAVANLDHALNWVVARPGRLVQDLITRATVVVGALPAALFTIRQPRGAERPARGCDGIARHQRPIQQLPACTFRGVPNNGGTWCCAAEETRAAVVSASRARRRIRRCTGTTPAAKSLGNLVDRQGETVADVIRSRGGDAGRVGQLQTGYGQKTVGAVTEFAAKTDGEAVKATRMVNQAGSQGKGGK